MLKAFLISFILTSCFIFTAHNIHEAKASLDRCEVLIKEIKQQGEHLEQMKKIYNF